MTKSEAEQKILSTIKEINEAGFRVLVSVICPEVDGFGEPYGAYSFEEALPTLDCINILADD